MALKAYPNRVEVTSRSSVFDPEVFCNLLYDQIALSNFSVAVGSTTANPQDPDCEIFANLQDTEYDMLDTRDKIMHAFASATHAEITWRSAQGGQE